VELWKVIRGDSGGRVEIIDENVRDMRTMNHLERGSIVFEEVESFEIEVGR
jgi:hypothetical protein